MVVPERNVAPKSLPVRSCMVRMANSRFSAFWLPSELPSPATRSWRCLLYTSDAADELDGVDL
eukprot:8341079-Prorocentrum_lima.AAC.1